MCLCVDFPQAVFRPSPNFNERQDFEKPTVIVIHFTDMESDEAALNWLTTPLSNVSAHYLIGHDGKVHQMVREKDRAWHAGLGRWRGRDDINSASIGIEISHMAYRSLETALNESGWSCLSEFPPKKEPPQPPFPAKQISVLMMLLQSICSRWSIHPHSIFGHSDLAPLRRTDPGASFPWSQLAEKGFGLWVLPQPLEKGPTFARGDVSLSVDVLQQMLRFLGYEIAVNGVFDKTMETIVMAFQRHWRQKKVDGVLDVSSIRTLWDLLFKTYDSIALSHFTRSKEIMSIVSS